MVVEHAVYPDTFSLDIVIQQTFWVQPVFAPELVQEGVVAGAVATGIYLEGPQVGVPVFELAAAYLIFVARFGSRGFVCKPY